MRWELTIEPQIYREDELEQELERTKEKLARQRKSSKGSAEVVAERRRPASVASSENSEQELVCEICERPGHDIFSCSLLQDGSSSPTDKREGARVRGPPAGAELFCEDCESHGHLAAECPHSLDVF